MYKENKTQKSSQRRQNRVAALQFLYQWELNKPEELLDSLRIFIENQSEERSYYEFSESLILKTIENIDMIDSKISDNANNWKFDRIAKVDLAILRIALCELYFRDDIPPIVSINEAIDLGKSFSSPDSKRFINGILDKIKETIGRPLRKPSNS